MFSRKNLLHKQIRNFLVRTYKHFTTPYHRNVQYEVAVVFQFNNNFTVFTFFQNGSGSITFQRSKNKKILKCNSNIPKHGEYGLPAETHLGVCNNIVVHSKEFEINWRKEWWKNGKRHRDWDLPAVESNCFKEWFKNGLRHRDIINGPAVINEWGEIWWVAGRKMKNITSPGLRKNEFYEKYYKPDGWT